MLSLGWIYAVTIRAILFCDALLLKVTGLFIDLHIIVRILSYVMIFNRNLCFQLVFDSSAVKFYILNYLIFNFLLKIEINF